MATSEREEDVNWALYAGLRDPLREGVIPMMGVRELGGIEGVSKEWYRRARAVRMRHIYAQERAIDSWLLWVLDESFDPYRERARTALEKLLPDQRLEDLTGRKIIASIILPNLRGIRQAARRGNIAKAYILMLRLVGELMIPLPVMRELLMVLPPQVENALYNWEVREYQRIVEYLPLGDNMNDDYFLLEAVRSIGDVMNVSHKGVSDDNARIIIERLEDNFTDSDGKLNLMLVAGDGNRAKAFFLDVARKVKNKPYVLPMSKMLDKVPWFMPENWSW